MVLPIVGTLHSLFRVLVHHCDGSFIEPGLQTQPHQQDVGQGQTSKGPVEPVRVRGWTRWLPPRCKDRLA